MKTYSVCPNSVLREMCVRNDWFTAGTGEQYAKMFEANELGAPLRDIAVIIWICSDISDDYELSDIISKLESAQEDYLIDLGQDFVAMRERGADEIYCAEFE